MSAAVWVFARNLPPSVAASFTCVKITEAGLSSEDRLLSYAYALEQAAPPRKPPMSTPPLPGEP